MPDDKARGRGPGRAFNDGRIADWLRKSGILGFRTVRLAQEAFLQQQSLDPDVAVAAGTPA